VATKRRSISAFILWGIVGFGIGGAIAGTIAVDAAIFLGFAIMAGIGGTSLGLALRSWKIAGYLALAGAVALSIMEQVEGSIFMLPLLSGVTHMAIWGIILGALLGATLGYLEKRKPMQSSSN